MDTPEHGDLRANETRNSIGLQEKVFKREEFLVPWMNIGTTLIAH